MVKRWCTRVPAADMTPSTYALGNGVLNIVFVLGPLVVGMLRLLRTTEKTRTLVMATTALDRRRAATQPTNPGQGPWR